jgi:hypothetical protein
VIDKLDISKLKPKELTLYRRDYLDLFFSSIIGSQSYSKGKHTGM